MKNSIILLVVILSACNFNKHSNRMVSITNNGYERERLKEQIPENISVRHEEKENIINDNNFSRLKLKVILGFMQISGGFEIISENYGLGVLIGSGLIGSGARSIGLYDNAQEENDFSDYIKNCGVEFTKSIILCLTIPLVFYSTLLILYIFASDLPDLIKCILFYILSGSLEMVVNNLFFSKIITKLSLSYKKYLNTKKINIFDVLAHSMGSIAGLCIGDYLYSNSKLDSSNTISEGYLIAGFIGSGLATIAEYKYHRLSKKELYTKFIQRFILSGTLGSSVSYLSYKENELRD